ncbi:MAG: hypothetical protein LBR15_06355 [Methanobrevibacter sp.]|jgi:hypothetical protein|nr:hypothetical protein [Candidatus Methanovirga australis]
MIKVREPCIYNEYWNLVRGSDLEKKVGTDVAIWIELPEYIKEKYRAPKVEMVKKTARMTTGGKFHLLRPSVFEMANRPLIPNTPIKKYGRNYYETCIEEDIIYPIHPSNQNTVKKETEDV